MSDNTPDTDEITDAIANGLEHSGLGSEMPRAATRSVHESERLAKSLKLDARRVESNDIEDGLASEHARQVLQDDLEELYRNDLDMNNPPDSIEAFEQRVTLRNLTTVATQHGSPTNVVFGHRDIVFEVADEPDTKSIEGVMEMSEPVGEARSKKAIDRMVDYGQVAEQFLAIVAENKEVHPEIAEYALDALGELQEKETERQSLIDTLRQWWSGGGRP